LFPYFRPQDFIDIIIMSFLVYQLYRWFKNTKALQIVIGLGFLVILYFVTKNLDLYMTSWILQELGTVLFVLIIVIFQTEIRQALYRFSPLRNLFGRQANGFRLDLMELSRTIFVLAGEKTGALIVFQRKEPLDEYLMHGVPLDGLVSAQLLASIFRDGTPLHDGAVVISDGRITQASCHLPLSASSELPQHYGTRHRAALGLSERSDAAVIAISEERGEVSLALSGVMEKIDTPEHLSEKLHRILVSPDQEVVRVSFREKMFSNLRPKLITLLLVIVSWFIITAKQGGILTVSAPLKFHNLPGNLILVKNSPEEVEVQIKVISRLIPSPKQLDIVVDLDLAKIREGVNHLAVKNEDIQLPLGVVVSGINPSVVKVTTEKKVRKTLQVRTKMIGSLPGGLSVRNLRTEPSTVVAEGPERVLAQLESVSTEDIDLTKVRRNMTLEKGLLQPAPLVKLLREEPVKIQLVVSGR
jgi:diadenylate cyclase